jgi:hypothetical protein
MNSEHRAEAIGRCSALSTNSLHYVFLVKATVPTGKRLHADAEIEEFAK